MAKVLCIEIGYSQTKICEMDLKKENPRIYKAIQIETPKEAIYDGELTISADLVTALKDTLIANKIRTRQAVFSITSTKIANREIFIPLVKDSKIETLIKTNSADYFPIDMDMYEVGHIILDKVEREKIGLQYKVLVFAVPKVILEGYTSLAQEIGLTITALDYSGNSIYQVVKTEQDVEVEMIIKADEKTTIITIMNKQSLVLQRTIPYGIKEELNYLINGIERVMDYYNSKYVDHPIQQIRLTGLGADFHELDSLLSLKMEIPVEKLYKTEGIVFDKNIDDKVFNQYIVCIGSGMAPAFWAKSKNEKRQELYSSGRQFELRKFAFAIAVLGTGVSIFLVIFSGLAYRDSLKEQEKLRNQITELEGIEQVYMEYLQEEYNLEKYQQLYNYTIKPNEYLTEFIKEMEEKMPSSIRVQAFSSDESQVNMQMTVGRKDEAAKLIEQFRTFESVENIKVSSIVDSGAKSVGDIENELGNVQFEISMNYKGATPTEALPTENETAENLQEVE